MLREQVTAPETFRVGRFEVSLLSDGLFALDGGAMYGTVPRTLWCRHHAPDDRNRIALALGCLLIKTPSGRRVLVDAGLGSKYERDPKFLEIYKVSRSGGLKAELKALGVEAGDISLVVNTHLHFDHAGGDTELDEDGRPVPAFPRARYIVQKLEWEDAARPHERNRASYMEQNYAPLQERKVLEPVDGEFELEPGLSVLRTGGHTRGHQCVRISSEGETALFLGDLVPTPAHLPLPYIMGYDLYPVETLEAKRGLLTQAAAEGWTLLFQHDTARRRTKVSSAGGKLVAV